MGMWYIAHSGVAGMHWYHRFHQSYKVKPTRSGKIGQEHFHVNGGTTKSVQNILKENKLKNLNKNIDKWAKDENHNTLFIAGISGSGKSTISNKLKDNNTDVIHLDLYFDNISDGYTDKQSKSFNKYMDKYCPDYKKLKWPLDKITMNEWGKVCEKFEQEVDNYSKEQFKKGNKIIVEGAQLLDDTYRPNKKYFKDKPVILCTTNPFISNYRANKRDNVSITPNEIFREIKNTFLWKDSIKKFKDEIGLQKGAKT